MAVWFPSLQNLLSEGHVRQLIIFKTFLLCERNNISHQLPLNYCQKCSEISERDAITQLYYYLYLFYAL